MTKRQTESATTNGGAVATLDERAVQQSAIKTLAERLGTNPSGVFLSSLRNVAFREPEITNEQLMALVVVANQYKLNPFTREIYAFPDKKTGGIVPVVSIDGWLRIINEQPDLDGIEYSETFDEHGKITAGTAKIYRKDRAHATVITESFSECKRNTDPWNQMPRRMMRHKAIIQCARVAFGFAGIYEPDEAERIVATGGARVVSATQGADAVRELLAVDQPNAKPAIDPEKLAEDARDAEQAIAEQRAKDAGVDQDELPV